MTFEVVRTPLDSPSTEKSKEVIKFDNLNNAYSTALAIRNASDSESRRSRVQISDTEHNVRMDISS